MSARAILSAATLLAAVPASVAGPLHAWIDRDGVYHVEDVPPASAQRSAPRAPRKIAPPATPPAAAAGPRNWWEKRSDAPPDEIDHAAQVYNIPAELVRAVIAVESAGNAEAVSHRGAIGLMQLMPSTAGRMYVEDPVDPAQNILGGTRYLRHLANEFGGDMVLVLAAYNAGPDAVRKYGGVPPFDETRQYVRRVMAVYFEMKRQSAEMKRQTARRPKPQFASTNGEPARAPDASPAARPRPDP